MCKAWAPVQLRLLLPRGSICQKVVRREEMLAPSIHTLAYWATSDCGHF